MRRRTTLWQRYTKILKGYRKVLMSRLTVLSAVPREVLILLGTTLLIGVGVPVFILIRSAPSPIVITDVHPVTVTVPFTKLTRGTQTVIAKRVNYRLTSPTELNELWKVVEAPGTPPRVDFNTHTVIAVFAGNETSATISVAKIEDSNTRTVSIAIAKLDRACAQVVPTASPYEIVAVPATSLPFTHEDLSMTARCPK